MFSIEKFFQENQYIRVDTPIVSSWLIPERHLSVFESENRYLLPSPELYLKMFLSHLDEHNTNGNYPNIYEIAHSFRREIHDEKHSSEFLMLEWYTSRESLIGSLICCLKLLQYVIQELCSTLATMYAQPSLLPFVNRSLQGSDAGIETSRTETLQQGTTHISEQHILKNLPAWCQALVHHTDLETSMLDRISRSEHILIMSMEEAFQHYAGLDLRTLIGCKTGYEAACYANIITDGENNNVGWDDWEDVFHYVLIDKIETQLPQDSFTVFTHYPGRVQTLAKHGNDIWSERWELYIGGVEIANCYVEETDPSRILQFSTYQLDSINNRHHEPGMGRRQGIPFNTDFLQTHRLPPYSGVALGVDRLVASLLYHTLPASDTEATTRMHNKHRHWDLRTYSSLACLQELEKDNRYPS